MLSIDGTESALYISNDSLNMGMVDMALSLNSLKFITHCYMPGMQAFLGR